MKTSFEDPFRNRCVLFLEKEIDHPFSRNIEKSIYNATIQKGRQEHISLHWENSIFKNLYLSKASDALDINSLKKISLFEYKECIIKCKS